ncbi:MAG: histidine kinase [Bacteroidota bacterium]
MQLIVVLFLLLLPGSVALAQPFIPVYLHYTVEDGLPSSETYMVIQDRQGYLWFATDRGVARYDGQQFQCYSIQDGLTDNSVLGLHEDQWGRIWFFTYSNQLFYYENGQIHASPANARLREINKPSIPCSVGVDDNGDVWIGFRMTSHSRMFSIVRPTGEVVSYTLPADEATAFGVVKSLSSGDRVWSLLDPLRAEDLLRIDADGTYRRHQIEEEIAVLERKTLADGFSVNLQKDRPFLFRWCNCVYRDGPSGLEKLFCTEPQHGTLGLLEDDRGYVWKATFGSGVQCYEPNRGDRPRFSLLLDKIVTCMYQDREGGIWLTTLNDGVYYIPAANFYQLPSDSHFGSRRIASLVGHSGRLLLGFYQGQVETVRYDELGFQDFEELYNFKYQSQVAPVDKAAKRWLIHGQTSRREGQAFILEDQQLQKLGYTDFYASVGFGETGLLLLWKSYLGHFDCHTQVLDTLFRGVLVDYKKIYVDSRQDIWLMGIPGVARLEAGELQAFDLGGKWSRQRVMAMAEYGSHLLFASLGEGLIVYGPGGEVWRITERDGLVSNQCNDLIIDEEGILWLSTSRGLSRIALDTLARRPRQIINYSRSNGLLSSDVKRTLVLDSLVWLQHDQGLSVFPRYFDANPRPGPKVHLQHLAINNRDTTLQPYYELGHQQNNLEFGFAGLSYRTGNKLRYRYRLLGLDSAWQYTQQSNLLYPKLPPGRYQFQVAARDYRGQWSEEPATVSLLIRQPFWNSWWFWGLLFLLGFGLLQLFILLRFRIIQNRERLLRRSFEAEQKALQSQLTPHFIFNTLGSIQGLILSGQYRLASQNLSGVARLIRTVLYHSRRSSISLSDEIEGLRNYLRLEQLRFGPELRWQIEVAEELDTDLLEIPPMLIQPFVENAIWHGLQQGTRGGQIDIRFRQAGRGIHCQVQDDGIGRRRARALRSPYQHGGLGVKIIEERIELLNKNCKVPFRLEVEDLEGERSGTRVHLFFPFNRN